jgi:hypothetical protein
MAPDIIQVKQDLFIEKATEKRRRRQRQKDEDDQGKTNSFRV